MLCDPEAWDVWLTGSVEEAELQVPLSWARRTTSIIAGGAVAVIDAFGAILASVTRVRKDYFG